VIFRGVFFFHAYKNKRPTVETLQPLSRFNKNPLSNNPLRKAIAKITYLWEEIDSLYFIPREMKIGVLGGGESGVGAALLAQKQGYSVLLSDAKTLSTARKESLRAAQIDLEENGHDALLRFSPDCVVKSPGIPPHVPILDKLRKQGCEIIGEIEFAYRHAKAPCIAITGTNGKTTTTLLTHHLLRQAGIKSVLSGNVGTSFARAVAEEPTPEVYVLEVSSFQLEDTVHFHPKAAALLNLTPDHLDRYAGSMEEYKKAKSKIIENLSSEDLLVVNQEDSFLFPMAKRSAEASGCTLLRFGHGENNELSINQEHLQAKTSRLPALQLSRSALPLAGLHNAENIAAALLLTSLFKIPEVTLQQGLASFHAPAHRMEVFLTTPDGRTFINDSKATNLEATLKALEAVPAPLFWLAGGVDKGNDYALIPEAIYQKIHTLICIGEEDDKLEHFFQGKIPRIISTKNAAEAFQFAWELSQAKDTVLLAPACASFDRFKSFEDRGEQFKTAILAQNASCR